MNGKKTTALYRAYSVTDQLLYVGISLSVMQRLSQHKTSSAWFKGASRIEVEWYPSRKAALEAELIAIRNEQPIYNKAGAVEREEPHVARQFHIGGSMSDLLFGVKAWLRMVGKWEDQAKAEQSIVMSLRHWKQAELNAPKVKELCQRKKRRDYERELGRPSIYWDIREGQ